MSIFLFAQVVFGWIWPTLGSAVATLSQIWKLKADPNGPSELR